jgi:hypothetical protein
MIENEEIKYARDMREGEDVEVGVVKCSIGLGL